MAAPISSQSRSGTGKYEALTEAAGKPISASGAPFRQKARPPEIIVDLCMQRIQGLFGWREPLVLVDLHPGVRETDTISQCMAAQFSEEAMQGLADLEARIRLPVPTCGLLSVRRFRNPSALSAAKPLAVVC